jgi:hypothetical protein
MSDKITMSWTDWRGNKITREVKQTIDVGDFVGTPGYALLVLAANANHLSAPEIDRFLQRQEVGRSLTYLKRRRWLFQQPGADNAANRDRNEARAVRIMHENPELSLRNLVVLLKEHGIIRSREWVRRHRCDPVGAPTDNRRP